MLTINQKDIKWQQKQNFKTLWVTLWADSGQTTLVGAVQHVPNSGGYICFILSW